MHCAVHANRFHTVEKLLQLGSDPNTRDDDRVTALHDAANHGYAEICKRFQTILCLSILHAYDVYP